MSQVPRHLKKRPGIAGTVVPAVTSRRAMVTTGAVVSLPAAGGMVASSPAFAVGAPQQGVGVPQQGAGAEAVAGVQTLATPKASVQAASSSKVVVLHYGSRGKYVRILQQRLGGLAVDGSFGPATLAKVKSFQRHHGLRVDGYVGPATWRALGGFPRGGSSKPSSCYVHVLRYGATGSLVRTAQRRLGHLTVDGSFGPATLRRVKSFQRSHHLSVDGIIGPATWNALGGYPCGSGGGGGSNPPSGPGDPSAHYRLPFPSGDTFKITQGPHGKYSHNTAYNKTAVDVGMPIGTPVLAARSGTVQSTGYTSAGGGRYVLIKDASGLCQVYFHLSRYRVAPGQHVSQGQRVASSGNSGDSTGPHLHFDLLHCSTWKSAKIMPTVARGTSYPTGTYITSHN